MKLGKQLFGLIEGTLAKQVSNLASSANSMLSDFDMSTQLQRFAERKASLIEKSNRLMRSAHDLLSETIDNVRDFVVSVPYESGRDALSFSFSDDNRLVIHVECNEENYHKSNDVSVLVPDNCIKEDAVAVYDEKKRVMVITIPKDVTKNPALCKVQEKAKECVTTVTQKATEIAETVSTKIAEAIPQQSEESKPIPTKKRKVKTKVTTDKVKVKVSKKGKAKTTA